MADSGGGVMSGGKGKGGDVPATPDFNSMAERQAQSSQQAVNQQTLANRANQTNALGASTQWTQGPNGQWTQSTNLARPLQQGVSGLEGQIANQGPLGTGDQAREQAISGIYNQAASRLDPQFAQREQQERSMLANQGLDPGSEAYNNEMGNFNRSRTDAYSSAMNNAIQGGTAAQQATFNENLAAQNNPYQQLQALQGMSGQAGYNQAGQGQATQYLPAAMAQYQGDLQKYGIQQQGKNSMMSGLSNLAGPAMMLAAG